MTSKNEQEEAISETQEEALLASELEEENQQEEIGATQNTIEFDEKKLGIVEEDKVEIKDTRTQADDDKAQQSQQINIKQKSANSVNPSKPPTAASKASCKNMGYNLGNCLFVRTSKANVRSGPGNSNTVVGVLKYLEFIRVSGRSGKWIKIAEGKWISQKTLSAFLQSFRLKADAEVYQGTSEDSKLLKVLKKGSLVEVQGIVHKWAQIGENQFILRRRLGKRE